MTELDTTTDYSARAAMVEGFARVVKVEGPVVWLEPEQTTSCGSCASAQMCGSKGIGSLASRLEARRFPMANDAGLAVGERAVVGVRDNALVKAAMIAYALPLGIMLVAGGLAQWAYGRDGATMGAMAGGLALGVILARVAARRLSARGEIAPRFLRRADLGETCHSE